MKFFTSKKRIILTLTGAVIVAAAVIAGVILTINALKFDDLKNIDQSKFTAVLPRDDKPILYIKNGSLFAKDKNGKGNAYDLSGSLCKNDIIETADTYANLVKQSKNAEYTYFIKDFSSSEYKGSLYATTDYKTSFKVDDSVVVENEYEYLKLSDNGKTALYMKNLTVDDTEVYSDLYYKNADEETSREIEKGMYAFQTEYEISKNGRFIAAFSKFNSETNVGGLIALENTGDIKHIDIEADAQIKLLSVTDDGKIIYTKSVLTDDDTSKSSICITDITTAQTKSYGENVSSSGVYVSDKGDKTVYIDSIDDAIYAYSVTFSSEPKLITDKYYGFTGIDVENECYIYAQATGEETYAEKQKVYIKTPELSSPALLCDNIYLPSDVSTSIDFKTIYYLSNYDSSTQKGELYKTEIKDNSLAESEKISDNVHSFKVSQGGNAVLFDTDYNSDENVSNIKVYTKNDNTVKDVCSATSINDTFLSIDGQSVIFCDKPENDVGLNFTSSLSSFDIYKNKPATKFEENASIAYYYYDLYLSSTTDNDIDIRNKFCVRSKDSVLYYKNVSDDYKTADLYISKNGKSSLVDNNVSVLLFE